jgi:putative endonuclease
VRPCNQEYAHGPESAAVFPPGEAETFPNTRAKGASAEERAAEYLAGKGFTILKRNYRVRTGEIDCIARDKDGTLVFVEVKSARTGTCGHPFSWITKAKQRTLAKVAQWYLSEQQISSCACRFDAIAVTMDGNIEHLRNAFLT